VVSGGFKGEGGDGAGGAPPPLLTGWILKQIKLLHENALFLPKIFKHFMGRGLDFTPYPSPLFQISGSAAAYGCY